MQRETFPGLRVDCFFSKSHVDVFGPNSAFMSEKSKKLDGDGTKVQRENK